MPDAAPASHQRGPRADPGRRRSGCSMRTGSARSASTGSSPSQAWPRRPSTSISPPRTTWCSPISTRSTASGAEQLHQAAAAPGRPGRPARRDVRRPRARMPSRGLPGLCVHQRRGRERGRDVRARPDVGPQGTRSGAGCVTWPRRPARPTRRPLAVPHAPARRRPGERLGRRGERRPGRGEGVGPGSGRSSTSARTDRSWNLSADSP